ncbi:MAG: Do family serine endopeptidase [Thermoguttaceae bacterium]
MPLISICRRRPWFIGWLFIAAFAATNTWVCQSARAQDDEGAAKGKSLSQAFRSAAHKVIPTVVKIKNITKGKRVEGLTGNTRGENPFRGTPLEDFFDGETLPPGFQFHGFIPPRMGVGSGVIIDPKGIILTNYHVVEGSDEVLVELVDGRQLKATDIKTDEQSDLAVMRVKTNRPLPAAAFGDSDAMDIGDWVIAIGCPFELDSTVSAGIISGKGRALSRDSRASFLQTDAAINPGNSGGPLVNLDGEVIGINTAIESSTGAYEGIGFAIPSNLVKWVSTQLIKNGSVERAYLGVKIGEINGDLADHLGVPPNSGVIISEVLPKSPAAAAGLQEGDIVLAFAEKKIANPQQLQELVERSAKGSNRQIDVLRNGQTMKLQAEVQPLPDKLASDALPPLGRDKNYERGPNFTSEELGVELRDLTPDIAQKLGLDANSGVIIAAVRPEGIAAPSGIRAGMIILLVEQKRVHSVAEFKAAMKDQSLEKGILLLVRTQSGNRFLLIK